MRPWIKLWCELLGDPQFLAMSEEMQARWMKLLLMREFGDLRKLDEFEIAEGLHISLRKLGETHRALIAKGWVEPDWNIPKWEARQGPTDPGAAERMRRHRRNVARNGSANDIVTSNAPARESKLEGEEDRSDRARAPAVTPAVTDPDRTRPDTGSDRAGPEAIALTRLAGELGGPRWVGWARDQLDAGYPAAWVSDVIRKAKTRGQLRMEYAAGILEKYREQGGPDREPGSPPPPKPPPPAVKPRWATSTGSGNGVYERMWRDAPPDLPEAEARRRSDDCPSCGGQGWARIYARAGRAPPLNIYCLCPIGEWMRSRASPEALRTMPDLAEVMTGKGPWTVVPPEESDHGEEPLS